MDVVSADEHLKQISDKEGTFSCCGLNTKYDQTNWIYYI